METGRIGSGRGTVVSSRASRSRSLIVAVAVCLAVPLGWSTAGAVTPAAEAAATPVRVMPLGDSLTGGPGCWRATLWTRLQSTGYTNVDFVGTLPGGGCDVAVWDGDNEGHGGFQAINTAQQNLLPGWLSATNPDIVMMNFGTNDIWNRRPTADIIAAFGTLLNQMRQHNPRIRLLVARISPVAPSGCETCQPATIALNEAISSWAAGATTAQSPITVVDHWTGWNPATDTTDGVHQTTAGDQKTAATWYTALTTALGAPSSPTPASPSASPTASPTVSPTPGTSVCSAVYTVGSAWQGGFQAEVTVTAGPAPVRGWRLSWTLGSGQAITQAWNATVVATGTAVTATGVSWNSALPASGTASFGFTASRSGGGPVDIPTLTCTVS